MFGVNLASLSFPTKVFRALSNPSVSTNSFPFKGTRKSFSSGLKKIQFHHKLGHQPYLHLPSIFVSVTIRFFPLCVQATTFFGQVKCETLIGSHFCLHDHTACYLQSGTSVMGGKNNRLLMSVSRSYYSHNLSLIM